MGDRPMREKAWAVEVMRRLDAFRGVLSARPIRRALRRRAGRLDWPVTAGAYVVGDPTAPVAVCTLTSRDLVAAAARLPGVAIAGRVYTANLGIEKIVENVTANPDIRFLVLCGRDSPLFYPGQTLVALFANGVGPDGRIVGAAGYLPVLRSVPLARIEAFRRQVELVDCIGVTDLDAISRQIRALVKRNPGPFRLGEPLPEVAPTSEPAFVAIQPGGKREPLVYDPKGFFVITLARPSDEIVLRHYLPDNTPAHEMRGRSAEPMLLGLVRAELVSQLSHAGYLGAELAKAEAALRLGLVYEQDQRLRRMEGTDR